MTSSLTVAPKEIDTQIALFSQPEDICNIRLTGRKYANNSCIKELTRYSAAKCLYTLRISHLEEAENYTAHIYRWDERILFNIGAMVRPLLPSVSDRITQFASVLVQTRLTQHRDAVQTLQLQERALLQGVPEYLQQQYDTDNINL